MDTLKRFNEASLQDKEEICSSLNMENITNFYGKCAKKVWKNFEMKNVGDYQDLYVQSDTLLLVNVFESFRNKYTEIFQLDSAHFYSLPG